MQSVSSPVGGDMDFDRDNTEEDGVSGGKIPNCSKCNVFKPPSTQCSFGHMLCFECVYDVSNCPCVGEDGTVCLKSFVKSASILKYTWMYGADMLPCRNEDKGCSVVIVGHAMELHLMTECPFRPVAKCPLTPCFKENIDILDYMQHLRLDHRMVKVEKASNSCVISTLFAYVREHITRSYKLLYCFGGAFLAVIHDYDDSVAYWVYVIRKPSYKQFRATIKIPYHTLDKNGNKGDTYMKHHELEKSHDVHSLNKPYEEILQEGQCIDIPKNTFEFPPESMDLFMQPTVVQYIIEEVPLQ